MASSSTTSPSSLVQTLNQKGVYCITTGRCNRAISFFVRAMEVSKQDQHHAPCNCEHCSLESCIEYSHSLVQEPSESALDEEDSCDFVQQFCNREDSKNDKNEGYLYRIPIVTTPQSMGHSMGSIMPKILTFNLALAHHLKALEEKQNNFKIAARLYQLVYQTELKEKSKASFFFALVAANNLADIHSRLSNIEKQEQCLKFVLSAIMLMGYDISSRNREYCKVKLDGFVRNATSLILTPSCAAVA